VITFYSFLFDYLSVLYFTLLLFRRCMDHSSAGFNKIVLTL